MRPNHGWVMMSLGGRRWVLVLGILGVATVASAAVILPNLFPLPDATGLVSTYNENGLIDQSTRNPFFQSLGTNGRTCDTCHIAGDAFGLSTNSISKTFYRTHGHDPLFAAVDGANCPDNTSNDAGAHSLLLKNGLIRVGIKVTNAQFKIQAYRDPYGCAVVTDPTDGAQTVSVYRRPLPTTNLRFLSAVMFDGRETLQPLTSAATFQANLMADLMHQSMDATLIHAQAASAPSVAQQTAIVNFELGLTSTQAFDYQAGWLNRHGGLGGAMALYNQEYHPGTNDPLGADPNGNPFTPAAFTLYSAWENPSGEDLNGRDDGDRAEYRRKIAAGEKLFNTRTAVITSVRGLNDNAALAKALGTTLPIAQFNGFCATCHDTPNVGNHSLPLALDIGTGHDPSVETDPLIENGVSQLSFPDLPLFEITGCPNPFADPNQPPTPYVILTTDPGKALVTGLCSDVARTKGPILRGLAARAPYFHNGAARNLSEVIDFYNQRFQMNFTKEEKEQLIAFLNSL